MQVTYIKESRASRGGLMMTKQGWWMLAGTVSWTWVGLHTGGRHYVWYMSRGREGGRQQGMNGTDGRNYRGRGGCPYVCRMYLHGIL